MADFVTVGAYRDQVRIYVGSGMTAELNVVNLEIPHASARLAPPAVALEHLLT